MDNSLKKIISDGISNLSGIFSSSKSSNTALGIDIGSSTIKVVQLKKRNGKAVLDTYGAISLGPYGKQDLGSVTNLPTEDIVKALVDVMRESNITTKTAVIAIPSSSSLIFTISLPGNLSDSQLASIIPIEARKYIPVNISEVTLDWFIIPSESNYYEDNLITVDLNKKDFSLGDSKEKKDEPVVEAKIEVLVVAIHNDIMTRYQDVLTKTAIHTDSYEMEIFSNIRSVLGHDTMPVLLMDFGASKTKLSIIDGGVVRVFHIVNRGSQDLTKNVAQSLGITFEEAEKLKRIVGLDSDNNADVARIIQTSVDYIFSDTNSIVLAYEKKYNKIISKVVLIGGGSLLRGLVDQAVKSLHAEVSLGDPFLKTEAPAFLVPILKNSGPEFAVAIGCALRQLS